MNTTQTSESLSRQGSSRRRFSVYRQLLKAKRLPSGPIHSSAPARPASQRVRTSWQLVRQFAALVWPFRWRMALVLATATLSTLLGLLPPAGTKVIIDYGLSGNPLPAWVVSAFPQLANPRTLLLAIVAGVALISLVKIAIHIVGRWQATLVTKQIQLKTRQRVFEHAIRLPLHRVQELRAGGVASILREDGGSVGELVFGMIFNPWRSIVQLAGSLFILAWVDWTLLLGATLLLPTVFWTHRAWISSIRPQFRAVRKQRELIDASATEAFSGIRVVRGFSRQRRETARFVTDNHLMARQELHAWWWMRAVEMVWEALIPIGSATLLLYGGWRVLDGQMTIGDLMMFLVYLLMLLEPLATLAESATQFQNSLSGLDRILDLLAEPLETPPSQATHKTASLASPGEISFENVSFAYPGSTQNAVTGISFRARAGTTTALVGPSGAGKTTLTNLVARFYQPTHGVISLDGTNIQNFDIESYRRLLGVVEQDVFLFDGTIRDNIAYARRDATFEDVLQAANAANATEFIDHWPDKFETVIGERGVKLSGGQRQRLAIARALLANPRLLILDEATSNLDTESEQLIQQSLSRLMQGRTTFVIAHRLSTIASADQILVVEQGAITQVGTHAELMERGGRYRDMVEQQVSLSLGTVAETRRSPADGCFPVRS